MEKHSLDVFFLLVREGLNSESCRYISGFTGSSAVLLIFKTRAVLISDGRYRTQANEQSPFEFCLCSKSPEVEAKKLIIENKCRKLGFEADKISYATYKNFLSELPLELEDASKFLPLIRRRKNPEEVGAIIEAGKIASDSYAEVLESVKIGMTESEFSNLLLYTIKKNGADDGWIGGEFVVASGERGALPHGRATKREFRAGDIVTVDFGAAIRGYMCDITRNFSVGKPAAPKQTLTIANLLVEAAEMAAAALAPGKSCADIDKIARDIISADGYGPNFAHGLGHGLGLEIHESPRISPLSDDVLSIGDVVTIEPGIYINGWGGMRIEDDYLITKDGAHCLTRKEELKGVTVLDLGDS